MVSGIIQASKLVLGSSLAKNNFFVQFWTKDVASSRMANCGSGLPAEWPFRSQNASDSPLPGGLWVKRLITHALCSLAYSDIAWCKLFSDFDHERSLLCIFCLQNTIVYWLISPSLSKKLTWLKFQGHIFRCIKHLSVSQLKYLYIVPVKLVTFHWRLFKIHLLLYQSDSYSKFPMAPFTNKNER